MGFLVAYDGSDLAREALRRADRFATRLAEPLETVTVVPTRASFARERGWLDPGDSFARDPVAAAVRAEVTGMASEAAVAVRFVDDRAPAGAIAREIRRAAVDGAASVVVLGSENAGRMVTPLTSVGRSVASDDRYDVFIVRRAGE